MKYYLNLLPLLLLIFSATKMNPYPSMMNREKYKITKLVEEKDVEYAYPHYSSNGKQILFQCNKTGKWQLYSMTDDIRSIFALTSDNSNNNFPDWSPDDSRICFVSDRTGNEEIFVMDSNGDNLVQLTNNPARDIHPYWSPDGKMIYFSSNRDNGSLDIYSLNPITKETKRLTNSKDEETCARKSPVSNEIVYLRNNDKGLDDIFLMNLDTKQETNISNNKNENGWPCWSADGKYIIYSEKQNDQHCLFKYNVQDKKLKQITFPSSPLNDGRANISHDGKHIVFNRQVYGNKNTIGIYVLDLD